MIRTEYFYRIRLKTSDIKKVVSVYNTLAEKSFIEFAPVGGLSSNVDVKFKNPLLTSELQKVGVLFHTKPIVKTQFIISCDSSCSQIDEVKNTDKSTIPVWDYFWKFRGLNERATWASVDLAKPASPILNETQKRDKIEIEIIDHLDPPVKGKSGRTINRIDTIIRAGGIEIYRESLSEKEYLADSGILRQFEEFIQSAELSKALSRHRCKR